MKLIITNTNKQGAVVHITNDKQRIESIKQRAKSKGDIVEVQQFYPTAKETLNKLRGE